MRRRKAAGRKPGEPAIAAAGREEANQRHLKSAGEIDKAIKAMEVDAEKNRGIYPLNGGKITVQEVLRRAGKSPAYLEKKTERMIALKRKVTDWVTQANDKVLRGAKTIRRAITDRITDADGRLKAIMQAWTEGELEFIEAQRAIEKLKQENAALLKQVSHGKVVPIERDRLK